MSAVELTIRVPARIAERVRIFAAVDKQSPEQFLASAVLSYVDSCSEAYHHNYNCGHPEEEEKRDTLQLNTPPKRGKAKKSR